MRPFKLYRIYLDPLYFSNKRRGGSRGRVQGVRGGGGGGRPPPPPPEMTCGFLIQLVFCKKNYVVCWCCSRARDECTPS